ncbi:MAG: L-rhamnose mutarotase [Cyclobacteriaceae bacterium]
MIKTNILGWLVLTLVLAACTPKGKKAAVKTVERELLVAVEFVSDQPERVDSLLRTNLEFSETVYRWKNHIVVFDSNQKVGGLVEFVADLLPGVEIKQYENPLYAYDKAIHCEKVEVADEWKHYLLTANLVADTIKQREYMDYHATQFEDWPEVAQGFCNADFQQLLVYRTGRQLLLVISVPADKTLDELNPLTVENNPRMDDWNAQMSGYQEGIEGTEDGEVWVFLE